METCWELPRPLCSAVLLSKAGSCPSPGCVVGIAERFCCSADYKVSESHSALLSVVSFPGGQQMLPSSSSSISIQGFGGHRELEPPCFAHSSQESCLPLLFQLPGILLAIAPLQLFASVTTNRSSHPSASVSPAVWGHLSLWDGRMRNAHGAQVLTHPLAYPLC